MLVTVLAPFSRSIELKQALFKIGSSERTLHNPKRLQEVSYVCIGGECSCVRSGGSSIVKESRWSR